MSLEELTKGIRVAVDVPAQQLGIGRRALAAACVGGLARLGQKRTTGTAAMIWFRADPSP